MKMLKLFRYVWVVNGQYLPSNTWYKMDGVTIKSLNYNKAINNALCYKNNDSWFIEFRDVIDND